MRSPYSLTPLRNRYPPRTLKPSLTRWFLALRLGQPEGDGLNRLLKMCNEVVREFGQPLLYERSEYAVRELGAGGSEHESRGGNGPRAGSGKKRRASVAKATRAATAAVPDRSDCFHISIAWTLQDRGGTGNGGSSGMSRTNLDRKDKPLPGYNDKI
ncbi:hypothetical protein GJ744_011110 [Endocarpon pusillum]|uniref:Uncharacterized protein n=1 Tax=Endocarpon pusillum TaxID=364733 RepID=A0A8H7E1D5_9EURO|nr:hypothetical protein GJ744_011110 [Endocarpon pusillum]